jgi:predicted RNase H-like HicB family nuclease
MIYITRCGVKGIRAGDTIGDRIVFDSTSWTNMRRNMMYRFLVIVEQTDGNYSAYSPELPGCVATGATREEAEERMHEAIELHIEGLRGDGLPIPPSRSSAIYVAVGRG